MSTQRIDGLDIFRGWAILFMVIYHFSFDLNHFQLISVDMNHSLGFLFSRYTIMSMFLLGVGMSLALAHRNGIKWKAVRKRLFLLGIAATLVTVATYIEFPYSWVYFGILHFILLASLLALVFLPYPKVALVTAVIILIGTATTLLHMHGVFAFLQPILNLPPYYSEDLVPLTPWFAVVLLGTVVVHYDLHKKIFTNKIFSSNFSGNKVLKFMGKNSLIIYLVHQPILFLVFDLFFSFSSK